MKSAIAGVLGAAALAAVSFAPTANAYTDSEIYFLNLQDSHSYEIRDAPKLYIQSAYWVCDRLNYVNGEVVVSELLVGNPDRTYLEELGFMVDAVTALCPWHDHTDEAPPAEVPPQLMIYAA